MGSWDRELIELLPASMRVMASAGAGFDWVNTETLAEFGMYACMCCMVHTLSILMHTCLGHSRRRTKLCMIVDARHDNAGLTIGTNQPPMAEGGRLTFCIALSFFFLFFCLIFLI